MAKLDTIKILFPLTTNLDWMFHQFEVKNAFLLDDFAKKVYMDIPQFQRQMLSIDCRNSLWTEIVSLCLVWPIYLGYEEVWLSAKQCR